MRDLPGKTTVEVHDYADTKVPMLTRMHGKRLTAYKRIGFTNPVIGEIPLFPGTEMAAPATTALAPARPARPAAALAAATVNGQLLPAESAREMLKPYAQCGPGTWQGLGVQIQYHGPVRLTGHGGTFPGFDAAACACPETGEARPPVLPAPHRPVHAERDGRDDRAASAGHWPGTRTMSASPWPPPPQSAAAPVPPPRRRSSMARVRTSRAPLIPTG
jgi:hypothetical protein